MRPRTTLRSLLCLSVFLLMLPAFGQSDVGINGNENRTGTLPVSSIAPSGATSGQVLAFNGTAWVPTTLSGAGTVSSVGLTVPSFLNVAGSPITSAGTISVSLIAQSPNLLFCGPVSGGTAAPTFRAMVYADLPFGVPHIGTAATNDQYLIYDANTAGYQVVNIPTLIPVNAVSTSNVSTLSGTTSIDGVSLFANNRVLLTAQSTASQNGIWVIKSGSWVRPPDYDTTTTVPPGVMVWAMSGGASNGANFWYLGGQNGVVVDTTSTTWSKLNGGGGVSSFSAGNLSPLFTTSVATATTTPALSFSLSNAGADTVFGNPTGSSGGPVFTGNPILSTVTAPDFYGSSTAGSNATYASSSGAGTDEVQTITASGAPSAATVTIPPSTLGTGGTFTVNSGDSDATVASNMAAVAAIGSTSNVSVTGSTSNTSGTPTFDAHVSANVTSGSTISTSLTVGSGSNRYAVAEVLVAGNSATSSGVTFGGTAMTLLKRYTALTWTVEIWGLAAPASGANTVTATCSSGNYVGAALEVSTWTNVAQASTLDTTASNSSGTSSVTATGTTTVANDLIIDGLVAYGNSTAGSGQTVLDTQNPTDGLGDFWYCQNSYKIASSTGSNSTSWSGIGGGGTLAWVALEPPPSGSINGSYTITYQGALANWPVSLLSTSSSGWSTAENTLGTTGLGNAYLNNASDYIDSDLRLVLSPQIVPSGTVPLVRIGKALSSGSTNGTYLGVNATPGFTGNLIDLQTNNTDEFKVDYQGNVSAPTLSLSTALPAGSGGTGSASVPSSGQIPVGNSGGTAYAPQTVGGDGTLNSSGSLTVTKTNGTSFAASATTDTTNAANISSGTLPAGRMPALTGDATSSSGSTATTVGKVQGVPYLSGTPAQSQIYRYNAANSDMETSTLAELQPCLAVATSNVSSLSGTTTIDGVSLVAGNRVLLTAQTTGSQNGLWTVQSSTWTRPVSYATGQSIPPSAWVPVAGGTTYSNTFWQMTGTTSNITVDTTSTTWKQMFPVATTGTPGLVKPDGTTISISGSTISTIGAPPTGSAGGDLSGTYPNPTVAKVQGTSYTSTAPTNDQYPLYDANTSQYSLLNAPALSAVKAVSTLNVSSLSGTSTTIDGVSLSAGDRVLLTGQTTGSQNGIWVVASGSWTRPSDYDTTTSVPAGVVVWAMSVGTSNGAAYWYLSGSSAVTVDTTSTTWTKFSSGGGGGGSGTVTSFSAGNLSPLFTTSVATSATTPALSFSLSNAGADTVFGNPTVSSAAPVFTGNPVLSTVTAPDFYGSSTAGSNGLFASSSGAGTDEVQTITASGATSSATVTIPPSTLGAGGTFTVNSGDSDSTVASNMAAVAAIGSTSNVSVSGSTSTSGGGTPTLDAHTSTNVTSASTMSLSITVGSGSSRYALASVMGGTSSGVTFGGTAMTLLVRYTAQGVTIETWGLANPGSGSKTVTATASGSYTEAALLVSTWTNVAQTSTADTTATNNSNSTSVTTTGTTSVAGDLIVDCLWAFSNSTHGTGQTALDTQNPNDGVGDSNYAENSYKVVSGSGSESMSWSGIGGGGIQAWVALKAVASSISGTYTITYQGALADWPVSLLTTTTSLWSTAETTLGATGQGNAYVNPSYTYVDKDSRLVVTPQVVPSSTIPMVEVGSALSSGNANGTYLGVNGTAGFTGNLADLQTAGTDEFKVDYGGNETVAGSITNNGTLTENTNLVQKLVSVTSSTTPTFNAASGNIFMMTLTGNVTSSTISNPTTGEVIRLILVQDSSGSRTMTWPSAIKLAGGSFTLTTTANKRDTLTLFYDGTNWDELGRATNE